jgi:hypothetical protein
MKFQIPLRIVGSLLIVYPVALFFKNTIPAYIITRLPYKAGLAGKLSEICILLEVLNFFVLIIAGIGMLFNSLKMTKLALINLALAMIMAPVILILGMIERGGLIGQLSIIIYPVVFLAYWFWYKDLLT